MNNVDDKVDDGWDRGWDEHKLRQLVRLAKLPFAEKLEWLENAQELVDAIRPKTTTHDGKPMPSIEDRSG